MATIMPRAQDREKEHFRFAVPPWHRLARVHMPMSALSIHRTTGVNCADFKRLSAATMLKQSELSPS